MGESSSQGERFKREATHGIVVGGPKCGIMSEMNVVPLIDVLLVLLVIFMIIPHRPTGLKAEIPQPAPPASRSRSNPILS